jgi:glutamate synthase (NADPH/NADH) small chain
MKRADASRSTEEIGEILPGVELENGLIHTQEDSSATSKAGVYAGGDLVRGASTVVAAVADGMKAAKEIDRFLKQ